MKLLIIEKPSMLSPLKQYCDIVLDETVDIIYTYGFGLWQYKIPKINFDAIPFTEKPNDLYPRTTNTDYCHRYLLNGKQEDLIVVNKHSSSEDVILALSELVTTVSSRLSFYEEIIIMPDADQTGAWSAKQFLEQLPQDKLPPVHALLLDHGHDEKSIRKAFSGRIEHKVGSGCFLDEYAERHRVKKSFDYWWYANSQLVLSELCKWTGIRSDKLISKYEFMLICIMAQQPKAIREFNIAKLMEKWKGTGKYESEGYWDTIGSAASRYQLLENALDRGALEKIETRGETFITISEKGRAFVSRLHPKSFDPDLSFRLAIWCKEKDMNAARRYISTFFRRQFRFQRKQLKVSYMSNEIVAYMMRSHNLSLIVSKSSKDALGDVFHVRTVDHKDAGMVSIESLQSGFYRVSIKTKDSVYSDIVQDIKSLEKGPLTPSGWVKEYGLKGIVQEAEFDDIRF